MSRHESAARGFLGALKAIEGRSYSEALNPDNEAWRPVDGIGREAFVLADWLHGEYRAAMEREAAAERPSASVKPRRDWILPFVAMAFHVPNVSSKDGAALEVLAGILAGGKSARLHQQLLP